MQSKFFFPALFLLLSLIPLFALFHLGLPITHDGQDHVARIANFYQNLSEGTIIPRWAPNLNWGYGHPILMFLYPLPSYIASFFHFLGFSFIDSTKLVFGITYILSGLSIYLWINEFLGKRAAFVSAMLYVFAPYRFVDLYVRGAIGEHVAFVFPPLLFYLLLKLTQRTSWWFVVGATGSFAGLILSHNAISIMFLPIIILYGLYLLWQSQRRTPFLKNFLACLLLGFSFTAFFWVPAFFEGKYTLRDIVTKGSFSSHFVEFSDLLFGGWSFGGSGQFTTQVGIIQWIVVIVSLLGIVYFWRKRAALRIMGLTLLGIFFLALFLMTSSSLSVWETISTLQKFQFPWRLLSITVFATAVLGGLAIAAIPNKKQNIALIFLLAALLFFNRDYWHAQNYIEKSEGFFTNVYHGTTDTGESSPIWSIRFMEHEPKAHIEAISGMADMEEIERKSTSHVYRISAVEKSRILENTLYFPGWEVLVDGQKTEVEFQDPTYRGLITFFVEKGAHDVTIRFKETKLRFLANVLTLVSAAIVIASGLFAWKLKRT